MTSAALKLGVRVYVSGNAKIFNGLSIFFVGHNHPQKKVFSKFVFQLVPKFDSAH